MTMIITNEATIDIIYARTKFFLWRKRHVAKTARWFSIAEITDVFAKRPPKGIVILALLSIEATGELERRGNRVRHVPTAGDGVVGDVVGINAGAVG